MPREKGFKHSEETIIKMRNSKKGKKMSDEMKEKCRKRMLGCKMSEKTKLKMSIARIGRKMSIASRKKLSDAKRGEKSHLWKGGINTLKISIRGCFKYRMWRSDVFTRDNFTCTICGKRGYGLNADHIKPFSSILYNNKIKTIEEAEVCEELWNINNGRTLCVECHRKTETYGGTKKKHLTNI